MLVGSDLKKIKYVAVEVIRKGIIKASNVECGLFMGIVTKQDKDKTDRNFLALVVSKSSVRLYNMDEYTILTIDVTDTESRYMTIFKQGVEDQIEAGTLLQEITSRLEEDKRLYTNDPNKELIDIDTYEDYPDAVLECDNLTADATPSKDSSTNSTDTSGTQQGTSSGGTNYVKKEPTVSNIKRKGKLPLSDTMKCMKDKVMRLAVGTFELKGLPIPECDREESKEEDKKTEKAGAGYMG